MINVDKVLIISVTLFENTRISWFPQYNQAFVHTSKNMFEYVDIKSFYDLKYLKLHQQQYLESLYVHEL